MTLADGLLEPQPELVLAPSWSWRADLRVS